MTRPPSKLAENDFHGPFKKLAVALNQLREFAISSAPVSTDTIKVARDTHGSKSTLADLKKVELTVCELVDGQWTEQTIFVVRDI